MTFPSLASPEVHKLSAIAARLQSNHDGEVLSAARLLTRALDRHGLRIGEIVQRALEPAPEAPKPKRTRTPKASPWQIDAIACLAMPDGFWTGNQTDFLLNVRSMAQSPSPKQLEYLAGLLRRAKQGVWQ